MDFKRMVEFGGSLDFRKYDPKYAPKKAKALGNKKVGDGARFKGRGYIQLTGRYNYKRAGQALGLPLEAKPELVEKPEVAAKVAVWFWQNRVQPKVDDFYDTKAATKPINPGLKGLEDRKEKFKDFKLSMIK
jgi:putative chitinase